MHPETYLPQHQQRERELLAMLAATSLTTAPQGAARRRRIEALAAAATDRWTSARAALAGRGSSDLCCAAA